MHVELKRVIELSISADLLRERLIGWSVLAGFTEGKALPDRWTFHRGSGWSAVWATDVREVPTEVTAVHLPLSGQVALSLVCSSMWGTETSEDRPRLQDDFDQLCAFLIAASRQERDRLGEEVRRRWQGTPPGSVTPAERGVREEGR
jgi:hypothetical protein